MQPEIFISYSRHDADHAIMLAERLRALGASVWLDTVFLSAAETWSAEIVNAINGCNTFIVILSPSSVASHNVTKEVALASEKKKRIVPLDLLPCQLNAAMEYALAGLQRISLADEAALIRSFAKLGYGQDAENEKIIPATNVMPLDPGMKRLAVLPFTDLSPDHDNEWFAEGMMDELIGTLGSLSALIVPGRSSVMQYRKDRPKASVIGNELGVCYIVEGSVRKAAEKIRITASLTDTQKDAQLWSEKFDGTFDDIFDLQERVANEISDGLKLLITPEDKKKIEKRRTDNPEAYELYKKGNSFFRRQTKQDFYFALNCFAEAIQLDPQYTAAFAISARTHLFLYERYERNESHLQMAEKMIDEAKKYDSELPFIYHALSELYLLRGKEVDALTAAIKFNKLEPKNANTYFHLAVIYSDLKNSAEAILHYEEGLLLDPTNLPAHFNLCLVYDLIEDQAKLTMAAVRALPYFERHVRKNPDDEQQRMNYAAILSFAGRTQESLLIVNSLLESPHADAVTIYNCASLIAKNGEQDKVLDALERSVKLGYANLDNFTTWDDEWQQMPRFKNLLKELQDKNQQIAIDD